MAIANSNFRSFRRQRNLTGELIGRLTDEILRGDLPPRSRLPTEHALMQTFGVSRTVVREAIAALRAEGLVETRQGSGAYVCEDPHRRPFRLEIDGAQSESNVFHIMELRICVEVEAAGLAARRRSGADLARIAAANDAFSDAIARGDPGIDADFDFHAAIGAASGNPYFLSFLDFIGRSIIPRRSVHRDMSDSARLGQQLQRIDREHRAIERAIADRNPALARRAMRTHLARSRERYAALIGREKVGT